ncbi:MAG: hypothetical protein MJ166_02525 [Clostridia bacterium]|nr:hypothetical protein [Clostridia bacterium]
MSFDRLVGQKDIKIRLSREYMGIPSHAVLFTGNEGIGKHEFAREYSKALLCSSPVASGGCGKCNNCIYFDANTHPDFIQVEAEKDKKNIKVDDIRDKVISDVKICPQISKRKVYLINADELNEEGQNALLKSLEEPPENIIFVLMCEDASRLLPTVCSRTNEFMLSAYSYSEIKSVISKINLTSDNKLSEDDLNFVANFSSGIIGRAIDLLSDTSFKETRTQLVDIITSIDQTGYAELLSSKLKFFEDNADNKEDILLMVLWIIGDLCILYKDRNSMHIKNQDCRDKLIMFLNRSKAINLNSLAKASASITLLERMLNVNVNYTLAISEMLLTLKKELGHD